MTDPARRLPERLPPWLDPYAALYPQLADSSASVVQTLNAALHRQPAVRLAAGLLRFVDAAELPPGEAYESFINRSAAVPTRDTLHDLCNGLVWLRFPALKRRLNELHAAQIAQHGIGPRRGPVRDALTLFDENAAVWQAPPVLVEALARRDWTALFGTHRALWHNARLTLVGHALIEKLCKPRKAITAHVWHVPAEVDDVQAWLVDWLTPTRLAAKTPLALPLLGVPGWWPANELPAFYDDAAVFRPRRS